MGHRGDPRRERPGTPAPPSGPVVHDRCRPRASHGAGRCAATLLALMLAVDELAGTLDADRALLWTGLAALLWVILLPAQLTAGDGWLASRTLLRTHRVRTDLLVSAHAPDGVSQRLVLRDALGNRVEIDPRALIADPALWHRVDTGVRRSLTNGTLRSGTQDLRRLSARIDGETAREVFRASGLN